MSSYSCKLKEKHNGLCKNYFEYLFTFFLTFPISIKPRMEIHSQSLSSLGSCKHPQKRKDMNPDRQSSQVSTKFSYMAIRRAQGFPETFPTPPVFACADNWLAQNKSHALRFALFICCYLYLSFVIKVFRLHLWNLGQCTKTSWVFFYCLFTGS